MNRIRGRAATIVAGACATAMLVIVPSAQAAVTQSSITAPKDVTYLLYNRDHPNTFAVSGTTNGTTGDHVDVNCYAGDKTTSVASTVPVNANGSFSVAAASVLQANTYRICQLRAVPAGTSPGLLTPFVGRRLLVGYSSTKNVNGGTNDGKLYDYYLYFQQLAGGNDFDSLGECGLDDGYLLDTNNALTTITWYCNAVLFRSEASTPTRSEIRIDGMNAYPPNEAFNINSAATSGFPALTSYSYSQNARTGNAVIHESDRFVKCPSATYPPTNVSCPNFVATGVTDARTITQDHAGRVVWITDVFKSTDGKKHTIDLLWDNYQRFHLGSGGDAKQVEYKFPGASSYSTHVDGDVVHLPSHPGTIFIRMHGAPDGDTATGRGAIVYSRPSDRAAFHWMTSSSEGFTLHQTARIPAHRSVTFRWAYIQDFHDATVATLAKHAAVVVKGCTVPKVVGKSLAAAKKAITHAHCAVGRVTRARSTKIGAGSVIRERPAAGTNIDYHGKVALVVSKGG